MQGAWLGKPEHTQGKADSQLQEMYSMVQCTCRLHPRQAEAASSPAWQRTTESVRGSAG